MFIAALAAVIAGCTYTGSLDTEQAFDTTIENGETANNTGEADAALPEVAQAELPDQETQTDRTSQPEQEPPVDRREREKVADQTQQQQTAQQNRAARRQRQENSDQDSAALQPVSAENNFGASPAAVKRTAALVNGFFRVCLGNIRDPNKMIAAYEEIGFKRTSQKHAHYKLGPLLAGIAFSPSQGVIVCYIGAKDLNARLLLHAVNLKMKGKLQNAHTLVRQNGVPIWTIGTSRTGTIGRVRVSREKINGQQEPSIVLRLTVSSSQSG
jgi:hypothetical protein